MKRLLWLRILIFGGNYGYYYTQPWGKVWYDGWTTNVFRRTWKWWREGWGRRTDGGHPYSWREFCWTLPHDKKGGL